MSLSQKTGKTESRLPSPPPPFTRSVEWRCPPTATFADLKTAADEMLSAAWPFEEYKTDCFRREEDKKLWDPRYGMRKHGAIVWTPVTGGVQEVYEDGDVLVAVRHLHKQWANTCNAFSDVREDALRMARETAGEGELESSFPPPPPILSFFPLPFHSQCFFFSSSSFLAMSS